MTISQQVQSCTKREEILVKTEVKTDKTETSVPIMYQLERDLEKVIKNYVEEETTLIGGLFFGLL